MNQDKAQPVYDLCHNSDGIKALNKFNGLLETRALTLNQRRIFLASLRSFNRHTIGGIAALVYRLSDELGSLLPYGAHRLAAQIMDAAMDEYGLRGTKPHDELFLDFAVHLGVSQEEVEDQSEGVHSAIELGDNLHGWYREVPVPFGLGTHIASEITGLAEFTGWAKPFLMFSDYRLLPTDAAYTYIKAHVDLEPQHSSFTKRCIGEYLNLNPNAGEQIIEGADSYLKLYAAMFTELSEAIFES